MAEHHPVSDIKQKSALNSGTCYSGNGRSSTAAAVAERGSSAGAGGGGLSGGLSQPAGWQSLLSFTILFLAWLAGFSSRLFAVIRFESIIHEFDPWWVEFEMFLRCAAYKLPLYQAALRRKFLLSHVRWTGCNITSWEARTFTKSNGVLVDEPPRTPQPACVDRIFNDAVRQIIILGSPGYYVGHCCPSVWSHVFLEIFAAFLPWIIILRVLLIILVYM